MLRLSIIAKSRCEMCDTIERGIAAMDAFEKTSSEMRDLIETRERMKLFEAEVGAARVRSLTNSKRRSDHKRKR